ncbi:class I SAM-dependent methyltransferase [Pandoraea vervacti]|nr:class I SAM-dependent methyltransferase [Pandoraea vervacti]
MSAYEHYVCPNCGCQAFSEHKTRAAEHADDADLKCNACEQTYAVLNGIPRFVPRDNYATSFGYQWNIHRRSQLDSHTGLPISRDRVFGVTKWPERMEGQRVLEAGSGAGRFTEILVGTGASVFSFDYSTAVDANAANNGHAPNLNLFQGDIFNIPLARASFDKVMCLGVLQHTPDPAKAFESLAAMVRPGGELVVDAYTRSVVSVLQWKYLLRPITMRMSPQTLYKVVATATPPLIPVTRLLRRLGGRAGARISPICEYSHLGLPDEINRDWAILDTFDMYSPAHDHPQSIADVSGWFSRAGFVDIDVGYGPNGVIGRGRRLEA